MTSVLVTGAAGFIGSAVARALGADAEEVRAVDAFSEYGGVARKQQRARGLARDVDVQVEAVDLAADSLVEHVRGVDTVFHLAAQPGVRTSWGDGFATYARDNVVATQRLLDAATQAGVRRVVYASSSSVYGNADSHPTSEEVQPRPVSPYGVTKLSGEHICAAYASRGGPSAIALRYFTVYGPGQRPDMALHRLFTVALCGGSFRRYGDGHQVRDLTYVDDIVRATVAAATTSAEGFVPINVAGGTQVTLAALIEKVGELVGHEVRVVEHPSAVGDVERTSACVERAAASLGWTPRIDIDDGLRRQLDWHRSMDLP